MKKIICIICLIFAFLLGACSTTVASADQEWPLKIWFHNENGRLQTFCLIDEDTGVNYVVVATNDTNGGDAPAITPRLNADGSLYVTD